MRDATIDHRQVRLPNASGLGYDKWKAQRGDLIIYREHYQTEPGQAPRYGTRTARVLGRVAYAAPIDDPKYPSPAVRDHLYVLALSDTLDYAYIRWVDPKDVERCIPVTPGSAAFLAEFLAPELPADLPDLCAYGIHADLTADQAWPTAERIAKRRAERSERGLTIDRRSGLVSGFRY